MRLVLALIIPLAVQPFACHAATATDLTRDLRQVELDPSECYRVHDLQIDKDDIHFYFTDGYLIFSKPVGDLRTSAVFTSEVEGGDAEVLLLAPNRSERRSLASYTASPNLNEHFGAAVLIFGDDTYRLLAEQIRANTFNKRSPEMGAVMRDQWTSVVRNLSASFEARLLLDVLSPHHRNQGCFIGAVSGNKLGNFDVIYEPRAPEQIAVGQVSGRGDRSFFDVWTSFAAQPFRNGTRKPIGPGFTLSNYRIDATLEPDLSLAVITRVKLKMAESGERVVPFEMSSRMRVSSATIDGAAAEVFQPESLRANLIRNNGNSLFLVFAPQPLDSGREYEIEFRHEGAVVEDTGNQVYYVGPRGTWYPNSAMQFARYELNFRYPKDLDLVTPGDVISDKTEGEWRITRRATAAPIRFAGFNLGIYDRERITRDGCTIEVCANRSVEDALKPRPSMPVLVPNPRRGRRPGVVNLPAERALSPRARLQELAGEVASAMQFMTARFGPPPLNTLEVSPVPGAFGQGFPGLVYLSTMSYLGREDAALAKLGPAERNFFVDVLQAHETAHQWWGNVVTSSGYHDDWLMEALANYSALLYLEKRDGRATLDAVLENYRKELLVKTETSQTIESAGPIVLGARLESSQTPVAWQSITYGKGSWILHMLRMLMGDDGFNAMLSQLRKRYEWKSISTEEFRQLAAEFLPAKSSDPKLELFFDQWVYGTGIPSLKLSYSIRGKPPAVKLTGTIAQSDVDAEFSVQAPVTVQLANGRQVTWVRTSGTPVEFSIALRQLPTRVFLDASSILAVHK